MRKIAWLPSLKSYSKMQVLLQSDAYRAILCDYICDYIKNAESDISDFTAVLPVIRTV